MTCSIYHAVEKKNMLCKFDSFQHFFKSQKVVIMHPLATPALAPTLVLVVQNENNFDTHAARTNNAKNIWGGLIISLLIVLIIGLLYLCCKRKLLSFLIHRRSSQKGCLDAKKITLRRFQLEELEKATKNFSESCLVGSGAFGNVYKGTFYADKGVTTLAIKKAHAASYQSVQEFRNEVMLLSKVKHRNLVRLVGFCEDSGAKGAKILIYEYVTNGSLLEYIMGRRGRHLTWRQRVNVAIGAAKGIAHLHEGIKPSIIHRDIKPSNILLGGDDGYEARVSDFGLVKTGPIGDQSHVSSQIKGTPGYLDPDYCSSFHLTPFSDVYSFGVILLQLIAARPAVDTTRSNSNYHIIQWARPSLEQGKIEEILDANLLLEQCNMDVMLKMGQLALKCMVKTPKQRPTMTQVWQELEEALYSVDNYFIHKQPSNAKERSTGSCRSSMPRPRLDEEADYSQSFVSIDGIGLQRFHVDMDSMSFQSTRLRCLESNSISIDVDIEKAKISEEISAEANINHKQTDV